MILREMNNARVSDNGALIQIPIIFHICYNYESKTSIEKDVEHFIDMLNRDYSKKCDNFDCGREVYKNSVFKDLYEKYVNRSANCNIVFTRKDVRYVNLPELKDTSIAKLDKAIKGPSPAIDPEYCLNLWVADLKGNLLGYAQFPWDLKDKPSTDGVVIEKGTFGSKPDFATFNLNKTATHEIGHWLGLYHVFQSTITKAEGFVDYKEGDDEQEYRGDCVVDTPSQGKPTTGNPLLRVRSWPRSRADDDNKYNYHMFMNFMDYSDDASMFMFTKDQVTKMRLLINIHRPKLVKKQSTEDHGHEEQENHDDQGNNSNQEQGNQEQGDQNNGGENKGEEVSQPTYNQLHFGFETGTEMQHWSLVRSARIRVGGGYTGNRCLTTNRTGYGMLSVNLGEVGNAMLSMWVKSFNYKTRLWVFIPARNRWLSTALPRSKTYKEQNFSLPGPYNSVNGKDYILAFGTVGNDIKYSFFDDIRIIDISQSNSRIAFQPSELLEE